MKKELLAPAGNFLCLKQAVHNGADAVYLAGKRFGARGYADNFTNEELVQAIKYCHLYGVKIYVTVNILIYEKELKDTLEYVEFLYRNQVDALIMQDIGLMRIVHQKYPNLEIHASTQTNTHTLSQIKMLEKLGVKRVVLAREMTLAEIKALETKMEIEVFIHGALCISYSGQCLFSSLLMNRSGNRGVCAQLCRLPYKLYQGDKEILTPGPYLLSPKELNTASLFDKLLESNITSFKIEGRMKSPEYVGFITKFYREIIDNYEKNKAIKIDEEKLKQLKVLFNRDFTNGHLFGDRNEKLMNLKSSNHQGIPLGNVVYVDKKHIKIKLTEDLAQEDGIRFVSDDKGLIVNYLYNQKGLLINKAKKNDIVVLDNKIGINNLGLVLKTSDHLLNETLRNYQEKKIKIKWLVKAKESEPLEIAITDYENTLTRQGNVVSRAINQPTTKEIITSKLKMLGDSPFEMEKIDGEIANNIFINMSDLKKLKQSLVKELITLRENKQNYAVVINEIEEKKIVKKKDQMVYYTAVVREEEQLKACLDNNIDIIYVDNGLLYQKYQKEKNIFLRLKRIMNSYPDLKAPSLLVGELGSVFEYSQSKEVVTDYFLNVVNKESVKFLTENGVKRVTLSVECSLEDIKEIRQKVDSDLEVVIYGRLEAMVNKYCPLNYVVNKENNCEVCQDGHKYYLENQGKRKYPLVMDRDKHLMHIFFHEVRDNIGLKKDLVEMGVNYFRLDFLDESYQEIVKVIQQVKC